MLPPQRVTGVLAGEFETVIRGSIPEASNESRGYRQPSTLPWTRWRDSWLSHGLEHPGGRHDRIGSRDRGAERSEFVHRSWPAYPRHLAALRAEVRRWLAPLALPGDAKNDLLLAVNEAASNCVEHAYTPATVDGTVELTFWTEPRSVCVEIVDHGGGGPPAVSPPGAVGGSRSCSGSSRWS